MTPIQLDRLQAELIDSNKRALDFVEAQVAGLRDAWGVRLQGVNMVNEDFRNFKFRAGCRTPVFFGNPPFVTNERGESKWRNIFADFVELSLLQGKGRATLHYILPLSITFSREYGLLRQMLRQAEIDVSVASFDNIPDTLFKSGKPRHTNTNKANSQRCSILTAIPAKASKVSATRLHRWSKAERAALLSSIPQFYDVTGYDFDDQFPRPANECIARYLTINSNSRPFSSLIRPNSDKHPLLVGAVARNYIPFRPDKDASCHVLEFGTKEEFLLGLGILSSRIFFEYWLTVGDGFHVTQSNILNFPISAALETSVRGRLSKIDAMWKRRCRFEKIKLNSGREARSFDFSNAAQALTLEAS